VNHQDHVNLIRQGIPSPGGAWADFGSGTGAFTLALAELIGPEGVIYSVDKDQASMRQLVMAMRKAFPDHQVHYLAADFTQPLDLPPLDGMLMANALHYYKHKEPLVQSTIRYLKPEGRFILVEYNVDQGNIWVPYPLSFQTWENLARRSGFADTRLLAKLPSRFLKEFFSAVSIAPAEMVLLR
jgi:ubiquinone/menaquinone biosynthesis C-methylase UbiE